MTEQEYIWQPPEYTKICEALRYFANRRDTVTYVTSVMKMRVHSERYRRELLKVIRYCTAFARRVLEALYEELPKKADTDQKQRTTRKPIERDPSDRRAFFFVLAAFQAKEAGSKGHVTDILRDLIAKHMNTYKLRPGDYYFASHVRDAIYKECAVILLNWCAPFIYEAAGHRDGAHATPDRLSDAQSDTKPGKKRQDDVRPLPTLEQVYDLWEAWHQEYQAALEQRMPFPARYEGKTLQEVGRRGIRWLLAHLHDQDTIEATLWHLDALLGYRAVTDLDELEEAALFPHPYSKNEKRERRLRVRYVHVQAPEIKGDRVVLGKKMNPP